MEKVEYPKIKIAAGLMQFGIYVGYNFDDEKIPNYLEELKNLIAAKRDALNKLEADVINLTNNL